MEINVNDLKINLRKEEVILLKEALLFNSLKIVEKESIKLDDEVVEFFRSTIIANYLQYIGFDTNYKLTEKGENLKRLMDVLFID